MTQIDSENKNPKQSTEPQFQKSHRRQIRLVELDQVLHHFPAASKILEIGAGAGWQAKYLTEKGFSVTAIEVKSSNYRALREFQIIEYDGRIIPKESESVDVIFSSNVLEHIRNIEDFHKEMQRVLKPGGIAVHIMPTSTWRLWTTLTFYIRRLIALSKVGRHELRSSSEAPSQLTYKKKPASLLFPVRHGERGNFVTEMFYFSELFWRSSFRSGGWVMKTVIPNGIFYSGNRIFGETLSLRARAALSRVLGSSCKIYVAQKPARHLHMVKPKPLQ